MNNKFLSKDVMTPEQRSRCMSHIRGRNTKPELLLRRALWAKGYRYRINSKLPGRPDLIFSRKRLAIFVDGCFWHGCPIHGTFPKTNSAFWKKKIQGNIERDNRVNRELERAGWEVLRFWEHEVEQDLDSLLGIISARLE